MKIIPIFIPHAGCPYKCVYCDQHKISGKSKIPTIKEVHSIIERSLKTIPKKETKEIAFFGGSFTYLPDKIQEKYLNSVFPYVKKGIIKNLRMSTHPESVSLSSMKRFKRKGGRLVELGIQSLNRDVLKRIKREVNFNIVKDSCKCIKKAGLKLGIQIMLGLPGDTLKKSIETCKKLIKFKPETVRIYPTLILEGTELAESFKKGKYKPLSLDRAIEESAKIGGIFEEKGINVIRIGLHPSRDLDSKKTLLGGPYHHSFGEMVRSRQMRNKILNVIKDKKVSNRSYIEIQAPENIFNFISVHKKIEKKFLEKKLGSPILYKKVGNKKIKIKDVRKTIALIDPRMPKEAKNRLKKLNYYLIEISLYGKLQNPIKGHPDMMIFNYDKKVIYEPHLKNVANLLEQNGYITLKGERISSCSYPEDIIYNVCAINGSIVRYKGRVERNIEKFKSKHILVKQGYAKCSIIPVDKKRIVTSDKSIKTMWEKNGGKTLIVTSGHIKLPGYKTGFIGGATGVNDKSIFFVGSLDSHPDGRKIRDFIRKSGKNIIELCDGPLYDVGTIMFFRPRKVSKFSLLS